MTAAPAAARRRPRAPLAAAATVLAALLGAARAEDPEPTPERNHTTETVGVAAAPAVSFDTDPCPPLPPESYFSVPSSLHGIAADGTAFVTRRGITFAVPGSRNYTWQSLCPVAAVQLDDGAQRWALRGGAFVPAVTGKPRAGEWAWCGEVTVTTTGATLVPSVSLTVNLTNTAAAGATCDWLEAAVPSGSPPPPPPPAGDDASALVTVTTGPWVPQRLQPPIDFKPKPGVPPEFRGYGRASSPLLPGGRDEAGHTIVTARRVTHCGRGGALCLTDKWSAMGAVRDDYSLTSMAQAPRFRALQLWRAGPAAGACGFLRLVNDSSSAITGMTAWVGVPTTAPLLGNPGPLNCTSVVRGPLLLVRNWESMNVGQPYPVAPEVVVSMSPRPVGTGSGGGGAPRSDDEGLSAAYGGLLGAAALVCVVTAAAIVYRQRRATSPSSAGGAVTWAGGSTKRGGVRAATQGVDGSDGDGTPAVATVSNPLSTGGVSGAAAAAAAAPAAR
jgi:hypothetical protein